MYITMFNMLFVTHLTIINTLLTETKITKRKRNEIRKKLHI